MRHHRGHIGDCKTGSVDQQRNQGRSDQHLSIGDYRVDAKASESHPWWSQIDDGCRIPISKCGPKNLDFDRDHIFEDSPAENLRGGHASG